MRRRPFLAALLLPLVLAACLGGGDCTGDPQLAGLSTAAGCTFGGGYKAETQNLETVAQERTQLAAELKAQNRELSAQLASLNDRERDLAGRLIEVNDDIAGMDSRLTNLLRQEQISQAEYDLRQSQLVDLTAQRRGLAPTDPQAARRITELESEIADLQRFLG